MKSNDPRAKQIKTELDRRKAQEQASWKADTFLTGLNLSTIKAWAEDPSLVSNEDALKFADKILSNDKELTKLWLPEWASAEQIQRFFKSQWHSDNLITAILSARDSRLKEGRLSKDAGTIIEKEEARVRADIERQKADIEEKVSKSQNLLQRQRALKGVGLSTATEADIAAIQATWDTLIANARAKAEADLAVFKWEVDNIEAEGMEWLRAAQRAATKTLNDWILQQAELQNTLIEQWKLTSDQWWNTLMDSLDVAWVDKEWADKFTSEASWILSDKFGNPILVNGKVVPIGGTSWEQWTAINGYVNLLKSEWVGSISSVPANLKDHVIAAYDAYAATQEVTNDHEWLALWLIEQLWMKSTEKNIQRLATMVRDKWAEGAREFIEKAWLNKDFEWPIWDAFENISGWLTESWAKAAQSIINDRLSNWDTNGAIDKLISAVDNWLATWVKSKIEAEKTILRDVSRWFVKYADWADRNPEVAKAWTKVWAAWEDVMQAFNDTGNPELAAMMTDMHTTLQTYRQNKSWAAFSEKEAEEYAAIFPWPFKSLALNEAKVDTLLNKSRSHLDDFYSDQMKWPYDEIFPEGIHKRFDPLAKIQVEEEEPGEFTPEENAQADEIFGSNTITEDATTGGTAATSVTGRTFNFTN